MGFALVCLRVVLWVLAIAATAEASDVLLARQLGCAMTCAQDYVSDTYTRTLCEWEYRLPYDKVQGQSTLRNWVPINLYPSTYAGTLSFATQCTHLFDSGFPADEFES